MPEAEPLVEVAATLEVRVLPRAPRLYFWAVQATFRDGPAQGGAAHLGLQWFPEGTPGRFANWGGYGPEGAVLPGSASRLPSRTGNPNTRDYEWAGGRPYRLRIHRPGPGTWRGEVADVANGTVTVVRDLFAAAGSLERPVVWSEVFAHCDDPSAAVRWSELTARTAEGRVVRAESVVVSYQPRHEGGCDNTTALTDEGGVLQVTNAERAVPSGARLLLG